MCNNLNRTNLLDERFSVNKMQKAVTIYSLLALEGVVVMVLAIGIAQVPGTFGFNWEEAGNLSRKFLMLGAGVSFVGILVSASILMFSKQQQVG